MSCGTRRTAASAAGAPVAIISAATYRRDHLPSFAVRFTAPVVARRRVVSSFTSGINRGWFARASVRWWSPCDSCRVVAQYSRSRVAHDETRPDRDNRRVRSRWPCTFTEGALVRSPSPHEYRVRVRVSPAAPTVRPRPFAAFCGAPRRASRVLSARSPADLE